MLIYCVCVYASVCARVCLSVYVQNVPIRCLIAVCLRQSLFVVLPDEGLW